MLFQNNQSVSGDGFVDGDGEGLGLSSGGLCGPAAGQPGNHEALNRLKSGWRCSAGASYMELACYHTLPLSQATQGCRSSQVASLMTSWKPARCWPSRKVEKQKQGKPCWKWWSTARTKRRWRSGRGQLQKKASKPKKCLWRQLLLCSGCLSWKHSLAIISFFLNIKRLKIKRPWSDHLSLPTDVFFQLQEKHFALWLYWIATYKALNAKRFRGLDWSCRGRLHRIWWALTFQIVFHMQKWLVHGLFLGCWHGHNILPQKGFGAIRANKITPAASFLTSTSRSCLQL